MTGHTRFISATPVLPSLDIHRSIEFFCSKLGFTKAHAEQGSYGIVNFRAVRIHFRACQERHIAENSSCRIQIEGADALFSTSASFGIVHPKAPLQDMPWGSREFAIVDPDGNLVTFSEGLAQQASARTRIAA